MEDGNEEGQFYFASTLEIPLENLSWEYYIVLLYKITAELGLAATYRAAFVQFLPILPGMRGLNTERSGGDKLFLVETCFGRWHWRLATLTGTVRGFTNVKICWDVEPVEIICLLTILWVTLFEGLSSSDLMKAIAEKQLVKRRIMHSDTKSSMLEQIMIVCQTVAKVYYLSGTWPFY